MSDALRVDFSQISGTDYRDVYRRLEEAAKDNKVLREALKKWVKAQHDAEAAFAKVDEIVTSMGGQNFGSLQDVLVDKLDLAEAIVGSSKGPAK